MAPRLAWMFAAFALLLAACGGPPANVAAEVSVEIAPSEVSIVVGASHTFTATVTGGTTNEVAWTVSDESVMTVESDGTVTGVAAGEAAVTATSSEGDGASDTATVTVTAEAEVLSVTVDPANAALLIGETVELTATVEVTGGLSQDVTWSSDEPTIVSVDADGIATAEATGTAIVTATSDADGSMSGSATVTVTSEASVLSVTIDQEAFDLPNGTSAMLTAEVLVSGGLSTDVTWSSDDESVAAIDETSGEVTGMAEGSALITATSVADDTMSDAITVTVTAAPATSLSGLTAQVMLGSEVELEWTVENADSIDVACSDGSGGSETSLQTGLSGAATSVTLPIPASDCQTIHVHATGDSSDSAAVLLTHVVTHSGNSGTGSLRAIVGFGSGSPVASGSVIGFAADVSEVVLVTKDLVSPNDAHMFLDGDFTISGRALDPVTIRSDDSLPNDVDSGAQVYRSRIFFVTSTATIHLDALVLRDGTFIGNGGALRNEGDLTITNSVLENNRAWIYGGAISNFGTLHVEDTVIQNNQAMVTDGERSVTFHCIDDADRTCSEGDLNYIGQLGTGGSGGGLYNGAGTATLTDTVIHGNEAMFSGGGIYANGGTVTMTGGEVDANTASDALVNFTSFSYGGGVANASSDSSQGTVLLTGVQVTGNESQQYGGGLANGTSASPDLTMTLTDVAITDNAANPADGFGGGAINHHTGDPDNLDELGSVSYVGNTAANSPHRHDVLVSSSSSLGFLSTTSATKPIEPSPSEFQMRR